MLRYKREVPTLCKQRLAVTTLQLAYQNTQTDSKPNSNHFSTSILPVT